MKSREYLIKQGLVKAGSRGRLPREAQAALAKAIANGMSFSDLDGNMGRIKPIKAVKPKKESKRIIAVAAESQKKIRKQHTVWGIDRGRNAGQMDLIIAFSNCDDCGKAIQYCKHETPKLPNWIKSKVYLAKPEI